MPKLPTYTAQLGDLPISGGRRASAEDFGAGIGEAGVGLARTAQREGAQLVEQEEQRDERNVIVSQAKIRQKYSKELEDAEISGGDTSAIRQRLQDDLSKVGEGVTTRRGLQAAEMHAANTMNIFDTAEANLNVRRARVQAVTQTREFIASQGATLTKNPSYLAIAEQESDAFIDTFTGIPKHEREAMKLAQRQHLNVAAVSQLVRLLPAETKAQLEKGEFNLTPEQRQQEIGRADAQIRAQAADEMRIRQEADYQRRELSSTTRDEWFKGIMAGTAKQADIVADLRLTPEHREHLVVFQKNWQDAKAGADRKSDLATVNDLLLRITAPEGDPTKIYTIDPVSEAMKAGKLSIHHFNMLRAEVANSRDPNNNTVTQRYHEAFNNLARAIGGDARYTQQFELQQFIVLSWAQAVRNKMDEKRKAGESPTTLFDPGNKDSVVTPEFIGQFVAAGRARSLKNTAAVARTSVKAGDVMDGYKFKGGNPADPANWAQTDAPDTEVAVEAAAPANDEATMAPANIAYRRSAGLPLPVQTFDGVKVRVGQTDDEPLTPRIQREYPQKSFENYSEYSRRIDALVKKARAAGAR